MAAMTLLQLAQMVKREAGITGSALTTVQSPVEEIARVVASISFAWTELQNLHEDWMWMRHGFYFNTVAQIQSYGYAQCTDVDTNLPISNFANWKTDSFRKYPVSTGPSGEMILPYWEYDSFRDLYLFGTQRTNYAPPVVFTVNPQKSILLGNAPDAIYNVNGEYFRGSYGLSLDNDTPDMPPQYHEMLGWKALEAYGLYESAPEAVLKGQTHYKGFLSRLEADQLPKISWGAPLA